MASEDIAWVDTCDGAVKANGKYAVCWSEKQQMLAETQSPY